MIARLCIASFPLVLAACATANSPSGNAADARSDSPDAEILPDIDAGNLVDASPGSPDASVADAQVPDAAPVLGDALLITEIVDATLSGGLPKYVELTNHSSASVDLSGYSLGVFSNGTTTLLGSISTVLSGSVMAGQSFVVSFEGSDSPGVGRFFEVYGEDPDDFGFSSQINGNDTVVLYLSDGTGSGGAATNNGSDATVVDVYGVIGVDGLGEPWDYTNGYASRKLASVTASPTFAAADWDFSGAEALDGADGPAIAAATTPGTR